MIPFEHLPAFKQWASFLPLLVAEARCLWIWGDPGSGVSTLAVWLAEQRGDGILDDAEHQPAQDVAAWLKAHPKGVLGSHRPPEDGSVAPIASVCLPFKLPGLEDDPACVASLLEVLADEEGVSRPLPPELGRMPCPGNLRGLRNRLVRWKLLGQLPEDGATGTGLLPLEIENFATNLHELERVLLHRALRRSCGNRVEAAERLGISRRQLYILIGRHGDPVRRESPTTNGPKRLTKKRQPPKFQ